MQMTDEHVDYVLERAQALLWSGSLHEVDEAHNLISKLIKDRMVQLQLQTQGCVCSRKRRGIKTRLRQLNKNS